jgi:aminoglycoside 2''-phosphotransferase
MSTLQLPSNYWALIQKTFPKLETREVEINCEGMVNDVVIINHEHVFRFSRNPGDEEDLGYEVKAIDFIRLYLSLNLPKVDFCSEEMISYPFITGVSLTNHLVLRFSNSEMDSLAREFGRGMHELHHIPIKNAKENGLRNSPTLVHGADGWRTFFDEGKNILLPQMGENRKKEFLKLERHAQSPHFLEYTPSVIHGDICSDHILVDPVKARVTGIIDWGTAGFGDPASDYVGIAFELGENFLHRMVEADPDIPSMIEKIRFWVQTMNWQILLKYHQTLDPAWINCIHPYNRDLHPVGSGWC